jgi:glycosyltransferase involved in cell wall biosynthesis
VTTSPNKAYRLPVRVLLSAYSCDPVNGSEHGVGWAFLMGALEACEEVHVLTRAENVGLIEEALSTHQSARCKVIPFSILGALEHRIFGLPGGEQIHYAFWQNRVRAHIKRLHGVYQYSLAHHVTYANDWGNVGVSGVRGLPYVWGPVGGVTRTPMRLIHYLGLRGAINEFARSVICGLSRSTVASRAAARSALFIAANPDVESRFRHTAKNITMEPNAAISGDYFHNPPVVEQSAGTNRIIGVGRLLPWKGWALAIDAIARSGPSTELVLIGEGPDRRRLVARAARRGVGDRVSFLGQGPRDEVIRRIATASTFLFPSFHDTSPWAVAEALSAGCPVVCLDLGGPPELVRRAGGTIISVRARDLVGALAASLENPRVPENRNVWRSDRMPEMLSGWYRSVLQVST